MKLTYQAILDDPSLLQRTLAGARRERAAAIHRLTAALFKSLFDRRPVRRPTRMLRRSAYG